MITIYTDGSCSNNRKDAANKGGYAFIYVSDNGKVYKFSGSENNTTNSRMEMRAIIEALRKISKPNEYTLYSDSSFIVQAIQNHSVREWQKSNWVSHKREIANQDLWLEYIEQVKRIYTLGCKLTVMKCQGHSGDTYNELADKLAKEAGR